MPQERSAHKCVHPHALDAEWWMQQGVAHTRTHTHSWRASLLPHHSMKKGCGDRHGESVWWWCGPLAGMQGVVAMVSCTAAQHGLEKRENEGGRGSQRVSRCDLCWHCMSMLTKNKRDRTHLACSCCCPLVACQPLRCAVLVCHTHAPSSSSPTHHCVASYTRCMCMHVCVSAQCAAHT